MRRKIEIPVCTYEPMGWVAVSFDADNFDDKRLHLLACSVEGGQFAPAEDGARHLANPPFLVKSEKPAPAANLDDEHAGELRNARLLDWGEKPFGDSATGIVWDGRNLWALDAGEKRICIIEKTETGKQLARCLADGPAGGR